MVTFTDMATEELKKKIRERITDAIDKLTAFAETKDKSSLKMMNFLPHFLRIWIFLRQFIA